MYLGIDIGGTKTRIALADNQGNLIANKKYLSNHDFGPDLYISELIRNARSLVASVGQGQSPDAVGIGCGGPIDSARGLVLSGSVLPNWRNVPLRQKIEDAFGIPVNMDNDATAAGFGEAVFGAGKGFDSIVYFTVSTGIGGGVILNGKPYRGANGNAGEFGHQTLAQRGRRCSCGKRGCLQAYASGPAIAQRAREAVSGKASRMLDLANGNIAEITAETVLEAALTGDQVAMEIWDETGRYLGHGVSNVINLFNPQRVILGGGVTKAGDMLFKPVKHYTALMTMPELFKVTEIIPAALGDDVGLYGAVALAMEIFNKKGR